MTAEAIALHPLPRAGARPAIASVGTALPRHYYEQDELLEAVRAVWRRQHYNDERLERLHEAVTVGGRHLALPLEGYAELDGFGAANRAFAKVGTELGLEACGRALAGAELCPSEVDAIFFTTVTGISTPTLDARLANLLPLRRDVRRIPMFGLGCVGGGAALGRMSDYLIAYPDHVAIVLSVELCSLTFSREDLSIENFIATGLFGDGAAAVVGMGARRASSGAAWSHPRVVGHRSVFYPDTEWVMGWEVHDGGFKVVLSGRLPELVEKSIAPDVDGFLADHGLGRADIDHWICHPGGPKVMNAVEAALELPPQALEASRRHLREVGNLSSASVLHVLGGIDERAAPGDRGLLLAMGPGFCAELALISW